RRVDAPGAARQPPGGEAARLPLGIRVPRDAEGDGLLVVDWHPEAQVVAGLAVGARRGEAVIGGEEVQGDLFVGLALDPRGGLDPEPGALPADLRAAQGPLWVAAGVQRRQVALVD